MFFLRPWGRIIHIGPHWADRYAAIRVRPREQDSKGVSNPLGTGTMTVDFTASTPRFNISNSGATIPNDIVITGTPNARSICADNKATFNGTITGNGGTMRIDDTYDVMTLNGAVSVPAGETITLRVNSSSSTSVCDEGLSGSSRCPCRCMSASPPPKRRGGRPRHRPLLGRPHRIVS